MNLHEQFKYKMNEFIDALVIFLKNLCYLKDWIRDKMCRWFA